jgi:hypothetical protein
MTQGGYSQTFPVWAYVKGFAALNRAAAGPNPRWPQCIFRVGLDENLKHHFNFPKSSSGPTKLNIVCGRRRFPIIVLGR